MFVYDDDNYVIDAEKDDCIVGEGSAYINHLTRVFHDYVYANYDEELEQFEHLFNMGEMLRYGAKYVLPQWKIDHPNEKLERTRDGKKLN